MTRDKLSKLIKSLKNNNEFRNVSLLDKLEEALEFYNENTKTFNIPKEKKKDLLNSLKDSSSFDFVSKLNSGDLTLSTALGENFKDFSKVVNNFVDNVGQMNVQEFAGIYSLTLPAHIERRTDKNTTSAYMIFAEAGSGKTTMVNHVIQTFNKNLIDFVRNYVGRKDINKAKESFKAYLSSLRPFYQDAWGVYDNKLFDSLISNSDKFVDYLSETLDRYLKKYGEDLSTEDLKKGAELETHFKTAQTSKTPIMKTGKGVEKEEVKYEIAFPKVIAGTADDPHSKNFADAFAHIIQKFGDDKFHLASAVVTLNADEATTMWLSQALKSVIKESEKGAEGIAHRRGLMLTLNREKFPELYDNNYYYKRIMDIYTDKEFANVLGLFLDYMRSGNKNDIEKVYNVFPKSKEIGSIVDEIVKKIDDFKTKGIINNEIIDNIENVINKYNEDPINTYGALQSAFKESENEVYNYPFIAGIKDIFDDETFVENIDKLATSNFSGLPQIKNIKREHVKKKTGNAFNIFQNIDKLKEEFSSKGVDNIKEDILSLTSKNREKLINKLKENINEINKLEPDEIKERFGNIIPKDKEAFHKLLKELESNISSIENGNLVRYSTVKELTRKINHFDICSISENKGKILFGRSEDLEDISSRSFEQMVHDLTTIDYFHQKGLIPKDARDAMIMKYAISAFGYDSPVSKSIFDTFGITTSRIQSLEDFYNAIKSIKPKYDENGIMDDESARKIADIFKQVEESAIIKNNKTAREELINKMVKDYLEHVITHHDVEDLDLPDGVKNMINIFSNPKNIKKIQQINKGSKFTNAMLTEMYKFFDSLNSDGEIPFEKEELLKEELKNLSEKSKDELEHPLSKLIKEMCEGGDTVMNNVANQVSKHIDMYSNNPMVSNVLFGTWSKMAELKYS